MKLRSALLLVLPLFGSLVAACKSSPPSVQASHWTVDSVPERMFRHFTGYRADRDGRFVDYQYQKKKSISNTLRRHFANNSPDSPFSAEDASQTHRRPPHSIAPDPLYYMGAESILLGFVALGASGGFVPIPVDSLLATFDGGWGEFFRGFTEGANAEAESPPGVSKFKVKNR